MAIKGLTDHVHFQTWCLPHETALLMTPYSDLEYGIAANGSLDTMAAVAILNFLKRRERRLADSWDAGRNVVGLA